MKKIALGAALVLLLVASTIGGVSWAGASATTLAAQQSPYLTALNYATISGTNWNTGPVSLYLDSQDSAHLVAIVTPSAGGRAQPAKGSFSTGFEIGSTTPGNHQIIGVQGGTRITAALWIYSAESVDQRTWDLLTNSTSGLAEIKKEVASIESNITDQYFGLKEIKDEVASIQSDVTDLLEPRDGSLVMGTDNDRSLIRDGYTQLYPATQYVDLTGKMSWEGMNYLSDVGGDDCAAVWTGTEMLVWDGNNTVGGRYNPATDTWRAMRSCDGDAPSQRWGFTAVWTGSEMIVWGGYYYDGEQQKVYLNDGYAYDPTYGWREIITDGAPQARAGHTAVWTGTEMIVWGGYTNESGQDAYLNSGGCYDPCDDEWTATYDGEGVPDGRAYHTAVWTGHEMIVWGGYTNESGQDAYLNSGGRYNPCGGEGEGEWTATSTYDAPSAREGHTAVWTGKEMIVWGGHAEGYDAFKSGGRYDPCSGWHRESDDEGEWSYICRHGAPEARAYHVAV
ncbi:MAG: hypothetical protein NTU41_14485, partial [Chloroflexi bacterium]|nr:hypothetical protein [Chloroflexota bacterium]